MQQRSLFPDGFEVHERALAALRSFDIGNALTLVRKARSIDARLVDLDPLEEALIWLGARLDGPPRASDLAETLRAVAREALAGQLSAPAAAFVDTAIAKFLTAGEPGARFLDPGERVPRALVDLIHGDSAGARASLTAILGDGHGERADLWGYLGDACHLQQRTAEASAAYARALLLGADEFDLWRVADRRLFEAWQHLRAAHGTAAVHLLFGEAWLHGTLSIPARNGWLTARQIARLLEATTDAATVTAPEPRYRRWCLLLYQDQTAGKAQIDVARREQMAELLPEPFARFMAACREREQRGNDARTANA